jgi:hypothetical protein
MKSDLSKYPLNIETGIVKAINQACQDENKVQLTHPLYKAQFSEEGLIIEPNKNELYWKWSLQSINGHKPAPISPRLKETDSKEFVDYYRDNITERYLFHKKNIEQLFIINNAPTSGDLCIEGDIFSKGTFEFINKYWQWKNEEGAVKLGQLYVYDALGNEVKAKFEVQADCTEIYIAQGDLETAIFPITIDPEIGTDDFRISDMGTDGNANFDAFDPSVAYNSTNDEYLIVWEGDDNSGSLVDNEYEIYGQRLDNTGAEIGTNDFRISDMGPDGNANFDAFEPGVVYNSTNNEYLVIWYGDDNIAPLVDNEFEIFGQRLDNTGVEIGTNDFRISDMGPNGDVNYGVFPVAPSVVYNSTNNEYLVVWPGDDNTAPLVDGELEVFGQRLSNLGAEIGTNDFRISDMGPDGDAAYSAFYPFVCFNPVFNNYLVVWTGDDNTAPLVENENEIFGQRLSGAGAEIGTNDFRISDMGPDGDTDYDASFPTAVYNTTNHEYLVVWYGDDNIAPLVLDEQEIFGQRLSVVGAEIGTNDFRISDMGTNGNTVYSAQTPYVTYNSDNNEYLVVWRGDDNTAPLINNDFEIFGQRIDNTGVEIGDNDFQISDMGGNAVYDAALYPVSTYNTTNQEYLIIWSGDDNTGSLADDEQEIFGQRYNSAVLPIELIDFSARLNKDKIDLKWQTASENNNLGFEIQRSKDGYDFENLGWQPGQKYSVNLIQYFYEDTQIENKQRYYYRLKQIDTNGTFSYSTIQTVETPNENNISIYPNPFQNEFFINIDELYNPLRFEIYNQMGQLLHSEVIENENRKLQMSHFPNGIYEVLFWREKEIIFRERLVK